VDSVVVIHTHWRVGRIHGLFVWCSVASRLEVPWYVENTSRRNVKRLNPKLIYSRVEIRTIIGI
jgi:hypothetical protein